MALDVIHKERGSDWSHQVSAVMKTRQLQCDQTLPLSVKGVACETVGQSCVELPSWSTILNWQYMH